MIYLLIVSKIIAFAQTVLRNGAKDCGCNAVTAATAVLMKVLCVSGDSRSLLGAKGDGVTEVA